MQDDFMHKAQSHWIPVGFILLAAACSVILFSWGGFLLGTMQGDIPWPATAEEESTYYGGRNLAYGAAIVALLGAAGAGFSFRSFSIPVRVTLGGLVALSVGVLGGVAFVIAYAVGERSSL